MEGRSRIICLKKQREMKRFKRPIAAFPLFALSPLTHEISAQAHGENSPKDQRPATMRHLDCENRRNRVSPNTRKTATQYDRGPIGLDLRCDPIKPDPTTGILTGLNHFPPDNVRLSEQTVHHIPGDGAGTRWLATEFESNQQEFSCNSPFALTDFPRLKGCASPASQSPLQHLNTIEQITLPDNKSTLNKEFYTLYFRRPDISPHAFRGEGAKKKPSPGSNKRRTTIYTDPGSVNPTIRNKWAKDDRYGDKQWAPTSITLLQPWWKTWWAIVAYIISSFMPGFGLFLWRTSKDSLREKKLRQQITLKVQELSKSHNDLLAAKNITEAINDILEGAHNWVTAEERCITCLSVAEKLTGSKFGYIGLLNEEGLLDTIAISNQKWEACGFSTGKAAAQIINIQIRGIDCSAIREQKPRIVNREEIETHPDRTPPPRASGDHVFSGGPLWGSKHHDDD